MRMHTDNFFYKRLRNRFFIMKYYNFTAIALVTMCLLLCSCKKEQVEPIDENSANLNNIDLTNPEIGQQSRYVLFRGEDIKDDDNFNFEYLPDTLAVEIISEDENGYMVKEFLTPGSRSLNGENNVAYADSTWYYYIYIDEADSSLKVKQRGNYYRTRLFFLYDEESRGLGLQQIASPETEIMGWKTSLPFTKNFVTARTSDFTLFDTKYESLNIVIDNRPMEEGLPGSTHIFSLEQGLIRSAEYSDYDGKGYGWDVLPQPKD